MLYYMSTSGVTQQSLMCSALWITDGSVVLPKFVGTIFPDVGKPVPATFRGKFGHPSLSQHGPLVAFAPAQVS